MLNIFKTYKIHFIIIAIIIMITAAFVPSSFSGKSPVQTDNTQYIGASKEIRDYRSAEDKYVLWTNAIFSGMPSYVVSNIPSSIFLKSLGLPKTPRIWVTIFKYVFCAFIMLLAFEVRPWLALVGAIGIGFATENFTLLDVGHNTKAIAIAYLPLIIAGCIWLSRKKYLLGISVLSVGMALQIAVNHLQITYYAGFIVVLFFLFQLIKHISESRINDFVVMSSLALLGAGIGLGANSLNLLMLNEYAAYSIRGKSELTISKDKENSNVKDGLTKDYTFSYSNGWSDVGATIIPNYSGGDSDKLGLYYGQIGSTSGPKYIGATIFILFILGLVLVKGPIKWWLVTTILITIILSMGGNHFTGINTFMYEHFPLYNKFRAPSMMMVLVQISAGLLGILGLERLFSDSKNVNFKHLTYAAGSGVAIILLLAYTGTTFNDFNSTPKYDETTGQVVYDSDTRYAQAIIQRQGQNPSPQAVESVKDQLVDRRLEEMKKDGNRSLFLIILVLLVLLLAYKKKLKTPYAIAILGTLITIDLWSVGKRYLNDKDFKKERVVSQPFQPYQADLEIKEDQSYYRVLDLTQSTLNSNRCAYFHKSIGGYSAVKIRRYQDLWDWHLSEDLGSGKIVDNGILNMLNMKYFIYPNQQQQGGTPQYGINNNHLGNAWVLQNTFVVENADSAILSLDRINTQTTGFVEKEHEELISVNKQFDSSASVELISYHPEKLVYEYSSNEECNIAFSEVYYDKGWNVYIDNEPVDHFRLNYIIRGLKAPAGKHIITFEFAPKTYTTGRTLSLAFGSIIYLLIAGSLFVWIRKEFSADSQDSKIE